MSDLKQRTKEVESKTVESFGGDRGPAAIGTGHDSAGVDARSTRDGGGAAVSGGPVRRDAGGGSGDAGDSWTIKLIAPASLMLPANAKTIVVSDATTLPQLIASIKALLPDGAEFTVSLKGEEMSEARMGLLRGATQLILKGSVAVVSQPDAAALLKPAPQPEPAPVAVLQPKPTPQPVPEPVVYREPEPVVRREPEPATKTPAAAPSAAKTPALSLVGRPERVIPLPYSDDPTVKKDKADVAGGQQDLLDEVTAAAKERERLEKEKRIKEEALAKQALDAAAAAEQRASQMVADKFLNLSIGGVEWKYYCDPSCVTVNDIKNYIIQQDRRFATADITLSVDGQELNPTNERHLLKHRAVVLSPTNPAGGVARSDTM